MNNVCCELESKSDFLTGMYLVTKVADKDLDENALNTIQDDCPDFILPFNYKSVNGETEITYKVGTLCKLQYFYGEISHADYIALWRGILNPLLECKDWFMSPCSFVLSAEYLYYDKNKKSVAYVYIPTIKACSGFGAFNEMAVEIAKNIKVSDPVLENKVLRSIIDDFNPDDFLKMLIEHHEKTETKKEKAYPVNTGADLQVGEDVNPGYSTQHDMPDINSYAPIAPPAPQKEGIFGGLKLFGGINKKPKEKKRNGFKNTVPDSILTAPLQETVDFNDFTEEVSTILSGAGLRYIGHAQHPMTIVVEIEEGNVFTIGRYDVNAGKKRSDFEFDAKTKAVSRRHAAIERTSSGYTIVDLSSSAGTYVEDTKIPPNTPVEIKEGSRVSFGNLGADYVWEIN